MEGQSCLGPIWEIPAVHPPARQRHTTATLFVTAPVAGEAHGADAGHPIGTTKLAQANADVPAQLASRAKAGDWTKPAAMAIPKEGYFKLEQGRYGPIFPKTPANYGFTIIAKIKPGREDVIRAWEKIEGAIAGDLLAPQLLPEMGPLHRRRHISCTKGYSIPTSTNTLKTRLLFSAKRVLTPSSKILRAFRMDWKTNPSIRQIRARTSMPKLSRIW